MEIERDDSVRMRQHEYPYWVRRGRGQLQTDRVPARPSEWWRHGTRQRDQGRFVVATSAKAGLILEGKSSRDSTEKDSYMKRLTNIFTQMRVDKNIGGLRACERRDVIVVLMLRAWE